MEELAKRKDIVITNADKGGALVIMDAEKYTNEANRHIFDKSNWMSSQEDSTLQLSNLVNGAIDRFIKENLLFNKLAEGLKSVNPKNSKFHFSLIIHPGRPVINSVTLSLPPRSHVLLTIIIIKQN